MGPVNTAPSSGKPAQNPNAVNAMISGDNMDTSGSGKERVTAISSEVLEFMDVINELLNTTEAQQLAFINKIEVGKGVIAVLCSLSLE